MLFSVIPKELLKRRYGKNCNHRLPLSEKQVKAKIKFATNGKIKMIGAYKGVREKTLFECMNCHYKWETEPYLIYKGYSHCPLESHQVQHTTQWLEEQMALTAGIEYSLLGEYKTINTLVLIKHNVCGKTFKMTPKVFLNMGQRCPYEASKRSNVKQIRKIVKTYLDKYLHVNPEPSFSEN